MTNQKKAAPAAKAASAPKPPKKLIPRTAPVHEAPIVEAETEAPAVMVPVPEVAAAPLPDSAVPATAKATAKAPSRSPRKPSREDETVAKHQKVLAEALVMAQSINYDQPKQMRQVTAKVAKAGKAVKPPKLAKPKKIKLVRDSYAMPEMEYGRIAELKKRLADLGSEVKKSELLRGGIALLAALNDTELKAVMDRVERIKTGRPVK